MKKILAILLFTTAIPVYAISTNPIVGGPSFEGDLTKHDEVQYFNFSLNT